MKNKITYFLLICGLLAVTATSCKDDLLYADDGPVPEGEAMVTARISDRWPKALGLNHARQVMSLSPSMTCMYYCITQQGNWLRHVH